MEHNAIEYRADLIGERSAGITAVQIYHDGDLVWSHRWFKDGATGPEYIEGLEDALNCLYSTPDDPYYCDMDEDGSPVDYNSGTTGVILTYANGKYTLGDNWRSYGQSTEIVDVLMIAGLIPEDILHEERAGDPKVAALFRALAESGP